MKKLLKVGIASVMSFIALSSVVFAAVPDLPTSQQEIDLFEKTKEILSTVLTWASAVIVTVAILMLLYAGFLFMTGGGEEEKLTKAKAFIKYGIIGIIVSVLAYSAQAIIKTTLGI